MIKARITIVFTKLQHIGGSFWHLVSQNQVGWYVAGYPCTWNGLGWFMNHDEYKLMTFWRICHNNPLKQIITLISSSSIISRTFDWSWRSEILSLLCMHHLSTATYISKLDSIITIYIIAIIKDNET